LWTPVGINGRYFMDGGMRSTANVDVARGAQRVVVLAPLPRSVSRKTSIRSQLERLAPREWSVVTPDPEALAAFGRNLLDPAKRAVAAEAGMRQSKDLVDEIRHVWG
jgi:NTE family protein